MSVHKVITVLNWVIQIERAAPMLRGMLPDLEPEWRKKVFSPDYVFEHAIAMGAEIANVRVPDWERRVDEDLVEMLLGRAPELHQDVLVVTDLCLGAAPPGVPDVGGAFLVQSGELRSFVAAYRQQLTPHFVDDDVLLASPAEERIRVFHHEGMVSDIDLKAKGHDRTLQ